MLSESFVMDQAHGRRAGKPQVSILQVGLSKTCRGQGAGAGSWAQAEPAQWPLAALCPGALLWAVLQAGTIALTRSRTLRAGWDTAMAAIKTSEFRF